MIQISHSKDGITTTFHNLKSKAHFMPVEEIKVKYHHNLHPTPEIFNPDEQCSSSEEYLIDTLKSWALAADTPKQKSLKILGKIGLFNSVSIHRWSADTALKLEKYSKESYRDFAVKKFEDFDDYEFTCEDYLELNRRLKQAMDNHIPQNTEYKRHRFVDCQGNEVTQGDDIAYALDGEIKVCKVIAVYEGKIKTSGGGITNDPKKVIKLFKPSTIKEEKQRQKIAQLIATGEQQNIELAYQIAKGTLKMSDVNYLALRLKMIECPDSDSFTCHEILISEIILFKLTIYWDAQYFIGIYEKPSNKVIFYDQLTRKEVFGLTADHLGREQAHKAYINKAVSLIKSDEFAKNILRTIKPVLHLNLKRRWFEMIAAGEKKADYREVKDYWSKRFSIDQGGKVKIFGKWHWAQDILIMFRNGYKPDAPEMLVECGGLHLSQGLQKWGAEASTKYYTLDLCKVIYASFFH